MQERPSHKELTKKLLDARRAFDESGYEAAEPAKLAPDFRALDLYDEKEIRLAIIWAFDEIQPEDYSGQHPPQKSYEPTVKGGELFSFTWTSKRFGGRMYFKFSLQRRNPDGAYRLFLFSLHEDRG